MGRKPKPRIRLSYSSFKRFSSIPKNRIFENEVNISSFNPILTKETDKTPENIQNSNNTPTYNNNLIDNTNNIIEFSKNTKKRHEETQQFITNWSNDDEFSFLAIYLLSLMVKTRIKLTKLVKLLSSRPYSQFYNHKFNYKVTLSNFVAIFKKFYGDYLISQNPLLIIYDEEYANLLQKLKNEEFKKFCLRETETEHVNQKLVNYVNKLFKLNLLTFKAKNILIPKNSNSIEENFKEYGTLYKIPINKINIKIDMSFYEKLKSFSSGNTLIIDNNLICNYLNSNN